jgi:hypothetical protein
MIKPMRLGLFDFLGFAIFAILAAAFPIRWLQGSDQWVNNADSYALRFFCKALIASMFIQAALFLVGAILPESKLRESFHVFIMITGLASLALLITVGRSF